MTDEQIYELAFKHCYATTAANGFIFDRERGHMLAFARALLSASKPAVAQDERTEFEAWGNETFNYGFQPQTWDDGAGPVAREPSYEHEGTQMAWEGWQARAASPATPAQSGEPIDYDRVVSICDAHGIGLPVDCIEMVVEIIRLAAPPAQTAQVEAKDE